ncbi:unnamed protein product [Peronospora destructor]|uniref:Uncharacterized protein n=1 Tax=Peronospora destructor TaxID=86335 RepID=A0AAV0V0W5_9STRA|nr:unnamed protein product [Peronospora destructor]
MQPTTFSLVASGTPELVAQSLGLDPMQLLQVFDPATSSADATLQLQVMNVFTARAMLAGFMVVTQLLNIIRASGKAALRYSENVYSGLEPPLQGITERIIRLAGNGSDVTECRACAKDQYGFRHSWAGLNVDESFLLRTTTGKYILCIEADATLKDRAFELRVMPKAPSPKDEELSVEDVSQAYRLPCDLGGESFVTLRDRTLLKQEVNVLIDSKAPLLLEVLKWCGRFVDGRKTLVLDVTSHNFTPLKLFLEHHGYTVLTPTEAVKFEERERAEIAAEAKAKDEAERKQREIADQTRGKHDSNLDIKQTTSGDLRKTEKKSSARSVSDNTTTQPQETGKPAMQSKDKESKADAKNGEGATTRRNNKP